MSDAVTEDTFEAVWIDHSWLFWEKFNEGGTLFSDDATNRAYEIHQHACDRLSGSPSEFDRVDAITTLRRVIARRVRTIKEIYELSELPLSTKPKRDLELLSYFGIVRPFMLKRLIDIRNIVEHQDSSPPPVDECLMFADLVWYFLRSTDPLVQTKIDKLLFEPPGTDIDSGDFHPAVELSFDRENSSELPDILAWINPSSLSYECRENWMKIDDAKVADYQNDESPDCQSEENCVALRTK